MKEALLAPAVGWMIRRTLRARFRAIYWNAAPAPRPGSVLISNHHSWHDGYLMYVLTKRWGLRPLLWAEEFDAFPLFGLLGAMRFPKGNASRRAATIRSTVRALAEGRTLVLFPEGVLHRPPELAPFGRALEWLESKCPGSEIVPIAIRIDASVHERPEAVLFVSSERPRASDAKPALERALAEAASMGCCSHVLFEGTKDVDERWRIPGRRA